MEGRVEGKDSVGGIVGVMKGGAITGGYFAGLVTGAHQVGGIVGNMGLQSGLASTIQFAHVRAEIVGDVAGGIAGQEIGRAAIYSSHARIVKRSGYALGGLVGRLRCGATIEDSYAQGKMAGSSQGGGLVGEVMNAHISYSYSSVFMTTPSQKFGGAIGEKDDDLIVSTSDGAWRYVCTGTHSTMPPSRITNVIYDSVLGSVNSVGTPVPSSAMRDQNTFAGWFGGGRAWRYVSGYMPVLNGLPRSVRIQ